MAETLPVEHPKSISTIPAEISEATTDKLLKIGNDYLLRHNNPDSATLCYSVIIQRYNNHKLQSEKELQAAISAMAALEYTNIYYESNYRNAIAYIIEAQHVAEHINAKDRLPEIYIAIGDLHATLFKITSANRVDTHRVSNALNYFRQAYKISTELKMWPQAVVAMINLIQLAEDFGTVSDIEADMKHFIQQKTPGSVQLSRFAQLFCEATLAKKSGDYDKAMACYEAMSKAIDTDQGRGRCELLVQQNKAVLYGLTGQHDKQYKSYQAILPLAKENDADEILVDAYHTFAEYHKNQGNTAEAERYQFLYLQLKDSLMNISNASDIEYMQLISDWTKREAEIVSWNHKNEQQRRIIIGVIILSIITLMACIFISWRYRKLQKRYRVLYEQNLQKLSDAEEERQTLTETNDSSERHKTEEVPPNTELVRKIRQVLELNSEVFSPDFTIRRLAELVNEKYWLVSQVINDEWGKNFNTVLAEYRILESCRRINDTENYGHLTIEGIAQSVGIKSRSNFSNTFKSIVGMPPSEYQKLARNKKT